MIACAHTLATPEHDLPAAIALFARLGFASVEILIDDGYDGAVAPGTSGAALARVRAHLDDANVACAHVTPYVRTLDALDDGVRRGAIAAMEDAIRIAAELGAAGVRVLAGRLEGPSFEARRATFVASMRDLSRAAKAAGVSLNIETKGWSFAADAATLVALIEAIGTSEVGVLLDPANIVIDGVDLASEVAAQLAHVRHVHFKDVRFVHAAGWAPCPAGDGAVPWRPVLEALHGAGYRGHLSTEYERRWHPTLPPAAAGLAVELARLRSLLAELPNGGPP